MLLYSGIVSIYPVSVHCLATGRSLSASPIAANPDPLLLAVPCAPVAPLTSRIVSLSSRVSGSPPPFRPIPNSWQQVALFQKDRGLGLVSRVSYAAWGNEKGAGLARYFRRDWSECNYFS
uniref:Uncharacterized protein n=1 Tax=Lynx canadensis TaxID=61383 RepID=A0A667IKR8_LYNCA